MEHAPWDQLREPHERLRWARIQWQLKKGIKPDAGAAAESMGIKPHTYRAYERAPDTSKHTVLDHQHAIQFGRKFGVSWQWLLTGDGSPLDVSLSDTERHMIEVFRTAPESRQAAVVLALEALLKSA